MCPHGGAWGLELAQKAIPIPPVFVEWNSCMSSLPCSFFIKIPTRSILAIWKQQLGRQTFPIWRVHWRKDAATSYVHLDLFYSVACVYLSFSLLTSTVLKSAPACQFTFSHILCTMCKSSRRLRPFGGNQELSPVRFAMAPYARSAFRAALCLQRIRFEAWPASALFTPFLISILAFLFHILVSCISPRNLLVRAGRFGNDNVSMSVKLARAYVAFKRFISEKKISCSQPEFTEGMASGPRFEFWVLEIYAVICHSGLFVSCFIGCAYLCCFSFVCIYVGYRFISCQLGCVITSFLISCFLLLCH